ncbi:hypothetical protein GSI_05061 [Ganoderma sinense ZZ0214-1]|uniref:Uncharacterized protein n=1 Tax=Ganoderma sinense ZZ0214-1 TaxID=1077348 RepID=A0A2G8SGQ7_9APHY|nr:hypothetical protein GSI_05061 [Ganoderma sinense ZZ0214-1]
MTGDPASSYDHTVRMSPMHSSPTTSVFATPTGMGEATGCASVPPLEQTLALQNQHNSSEDALGLQSHDNNQSSLMIVDGEDEWATLAGVSFLDHGSAPEPPANEIGATDFRIGTADRGSVNLPA